MPEPKPIGSEFVEADHEFRELLEYKETGVSDVAEQEGLAVRRFGEMWQQLYDAMQLAGDDPRRRAAAPMVRSYRVHLRDLEREYGFEQSWYS